MKVAVTGASGYLGRTFIDLFNNDFDIVAISRNSFHQGYSGVQIVKSNYSKDDLRKTLHNCDAVVHLAYAMATRENEEGGIESYQSSMEATENILSVAEESGIKNVIFASSRLIYPSYSDNPFCEEERIEPQNYYAKSKALMEKLCESYNSDYGMKIKILRFGQIVGADMKTAGLFSTFLKKAEKGEPLTLIGKSIRDYIYVKDACSAIKTALLCTALSGVFNISMGDGIDNKKMAEEIIKATNSKSTIIVEENNPQEEYDKMILCVRKAKDCLGFSCEYDTINKLVKDILKESEKSNNNEKQSIDSRSGKCAD